MRQAAQIPHLGAVIHGELFFVGEGRFKVAGDQFGELIDAVSQFRLHPASDLDVQSGALTLGQRVVGDIAGEHMAEAILGGTGQ